MKNPMTVDVSVSTVLAFVPRGKYLDVATVSKLFAANYAAKVTRIGEDTSVNNLDEYFDNGLPASKHVSLRASELGRLDLFRLAVESGCGIGHKSIEVAARRGHLKMLVYIAECRALCTQCAGTGASSGGHLGVLRWLFPGSKWCADQESGLFMRNAVMGGFLPMVRWIHQKGQELNKELLETSITHANLDMVKYIHHHKTWEEYPTSALLRAALRGHLEIMQWLREQGYPWSDGICMLLAKRGHIEAIKYARAHGCPWGMLKIRMVGGVVREALLDLECPV